MRQVNNNDLERVRKVTNGYREYVGTITYIGTTVFWITVDHVSYTGDPDEVPLYIQVYLIEKGK